MDNWAAGHVGAGIQPADAAIEEIKEELDIDVSKEDLDFLWVKFERKIYEKFIENEFGYAHLLKLENLPTNLQKDEVEEIKFVHIDDLKKDLQNNPEKYIGKTDYWFEIIEEIRKRI